MKKARTLIASWLLVTASLAAPQLAYFATSSWIVGVGVGVVVLGALGWLLVAASEKRNPALVASGIVAFVALMSGIIGTAGWQRAAALTFGRVLDGTHAQALAARPQTWVRIGDATVSSSSATVRLVRGDRNKPASQTTSTTVVAEIVGPATGAGKALYACGSSIVDQAGDEGWTPRGMIAPMDDDVERALRNEMPVAAEPWCLDLDRQETPAAAKADALVVALSFLLMLPLFLVGVIGIAIYARETPKR